MLPSCSDRKKEEQKPPQVKVEETISPADDEASKKTKTAFPTLDILPEGSILRRVRLPRYDKDFNPISLLTAEKLTVLDHSRIEAADVAIELYGSDGTVEAETKMRHAIYDQEDSTLNATEAIYIKGKSYLASGTGLIFDWKTKRGFLLGPASTLFQTPELAAMPMRHSHPSISRTCSIAGSLLTLSTSLMMAAPPAGLTKAQLAEMDRLATPVTQQITRRQEETTRTLADDAKRSTTADAAMAPFLRSIGQGALLVQTTPTNPAPPKPKVADPKTPTPKPAEGKDPKTPKKPAETTLRVECDGGLYFDSGAGVLAYLKNIRLSEPRFKLSCSHELKVFLEPKPEKPAKATDKKAPDTAMTKVIAANQKTIATDTAKKDTKKKDKSLSSFGAVKRIIATGAVKVTQKDDKGQLFIASGETASYDAKTGEMILRGGMPRLQQSAKQFLQAREPGMWIRIKKNGSIDTSHGKWTMEMVVPK